LRTPTPPDPERQSAVIGCREHADLNLETARRSLVLPRNDGTLPFEGGLTDDGHGRAAGQGEPRTIAVIGPDSHDPHAMLGDWAGASGQVDWMPYGHRRELVENVLDGVRAVVPADWTVTHTRGADIEVLVPDPSGPYWPDDEPKPPVFSPAPVDEAQLQEAAARAADYAVVVVGDTIALTGEGRSTATLTCTAGRSPASTRSPPPAYP
jgi:beta-glucosidase